MASASSPKVENSNGPDSGIVQDFLDFAESHEGDIYYITDEVLSFSGLKDKNGLKLIEAKVVQMPPYETRDHNLYGDYDSQVKLTIHADAKKHRGSGRGGDSLLKSVKTWLLEGTEEYLKILNQSIVKSEPEFHEVCSTVLVDCYCLSDFIGGVKDSPFYHDVWNKHMNKVIREGVCYAKGKVPSDLCKHLREHIDEVAEKTPVDYHPKSNDIVRDIVHPALYPYIKGVSKLKKNSKLPKDLESSKDGNDFWGRPYEESKFQWLPTPFKITNERKCLIQDYINNLDQALFPKLYEDLASLFEVMLPYFEEVWSYAKGMKFFQGEDDAPEEGEVTPFKKEKVSFNGKELQIITKIVDYTLQPEQTYEGVWHAEGMSHENIVMTGKLISCNFFGNYHGN